LRFFFSRAIGLQGPSRQAIKQKISSLIKGEDSTHPLSDQQLSDRLSENGILVARRTVTKYRIELGIPSSTARKR
jgi:RNA polymerase sigma-54 factor